MHESQGGNPIGKALVYSNLTINTPKDLICQENSPRQKIDPKMRR